MHDIENERIISYIPMLLRTNINEVLNNEVKY